MARRFLASLLATLMVVSAVPLGALAAGEGGCTHIHDDVCGFKEAVAGADCDHDCQPDAESGEIVHKEGCAYRAAVEGAPCQHTHDASCGGLECTCADKCAEDGVSTACALCSADMSKCAGKVQQTVECSESADCTAETHKEDCPKYAAPVVSCTKTTECAAETHDEGCPKYTAPVISCTKAADCAAQTHDEDCPKAPSAPQLSEAVRAVQASIDALPTGEAFLAMSEDEKEAAYENAAAVSGAYIALSEEEQGMVDATKLDALFAVINAGISKMENDPVRGAGTADDPYVVTDSSTAWGNASGDTWYVVQENITINKRITVTGTVNLTLGAGCTLNANNGIQVSPGNHLEINGPGKLVAVSGGSNAAIGGNSGQGGGSVTINGGTVNVTCTGDDNTGGAAIGGGFKGAAGTTVINGGTVTVICEHNAAIGGGSNSSGEDYKAKSTEIKGGTVYIRGGGGGAGISNPLTITSGIATIIGGEGNRWATPKNYMALSEGANVTGYSHLKVSVSTESIQAGAEPTLAPMEDWKDNIDWTTVRAVRFEPCTSHEAKSTTYVDGTQHTATCKWCANVGTENHSFDESGTCICCAVQTSYVNAEGAAQDAVGCLPVTASPTSLSEGWYVLSEELSNTNIAVTGNVNLILAGGTLGTVTFAGGNSANDALTIWGKTMDTAATIACIKCDDYSSGNFIMNSGSLTIPGKGSLALNTSGSVTINGGTLHSNTLQIAHIGIYGGTGVTINGGTVSATGTLAGIYGGQGAVNINGGTVTTCGSGSDASAFGTAPTLKPGVDWKVTKDNEPVSYGIRTGENYTGYTASGTVKIEPCDHSRVENGACVYCNQAYDASVTIGSQTTYYTTLEGAFQAADGKTATITVLKTTGAGNGTLNIANADSKITLTMADGVELKYYLGISAGSLTLASGTITGGVQVSGTGELTVTGGAINGEIKVDGGSASVKISGGTISGAYTGGTLYFVNGAKAELSGGTINGSISASAATLPPIREYLADGYAYKLDGTWVSDTSVTSLNGTITIHPVPVRITTQPANENIIAGTAGKALSVTAAATETGKEITYQWYDGAGNAIDGATSASYTLPANLSLGSHGYTCQVTCDGYTITSGAATVSVRPAAPTGVTGGRLTITGVNSTMEYSADGNTYTAVTGTSVTVSAAGTYRVRVAGTANYAPSDSVSVKVYDAKGEYSVTETRPNGSTRTEVTRDDGTSRVTETETKDGVTTTTVTNRDKDGNITNTIVTKTDSTGKVMEKITYSPDGSYVKDGYAPKIIEGSGKRFRGKDMMLRSDDEFCNFIKVTVNGSTLNERNYTAESGSIKITLSRSYLNKLKPGTYKLGIVSTNGTAEGTFVIPSHGSGWNPGTGDRILIAVAVLILSGAALGGVAIYVLKKRKK